MIASKLAAFRFIPGIACKMEGIELQWREPWYEVEKQADGDSDMLDVTAERIFIETTSITREATVEGAQKGQVSYGLAGEHAGPKRWLGAARYLGAVGASTHLAHGPISALERMVAIVDGLCPLPVAHAGRSYVSRSMAVAHKGWVRAHPLLT